MIGFVSHAVAESPLAQALTTISDGVSAAAAGAQIKLMTIRKIRIVTLLSQIRLLPTAAVAASTNSHRLNAFVLLVNTLAMIIERRHYTALIDTPTFARGNHTFELGFQGL